MSEMKDMALLGQYSGKGSEEAFAEIVRRHIDLVYSVALRYAGRAEDAQDIAQTVFTLLCRKAGKLREGTVLTGWLYETTRYTALRFMRNNIRRQLRERQAQAVGGDSESVWRHLAPLLEEGMTRLSEGDRTLLALRYFENKSGAETATALGIEEWAARKRIERAVEKLRLFFARRRVSVSAGALTAAISAHSVQAAPVALAGTVAAAAVANGVAGSGSVATVVTGALKLMTWTNTKTGIGGLIVAASLTVPFVIQHQAQAKMRELDQSARRRAEELSRLQEDNDRLSDSAANRSFASNQRQDLENLRIEAAALREETNEIARLGAEKRRLEAKIRHDQPKTVVEEKEDAMAKMSYSRSWVIAFHEYAEQNGGRFPAKFEDAAAFLSGDATNAAALATEQFEIVFHGMLSSLKAPQDVIALREKEAWEVTTSDNPNVKWAKAYCFADGHAEVHMERENNFDVFERKHSPDENGDTQTR
jgi:RNA polymerase sigma factor (sigma-70 family)